MSKIIEDRTAYIGKIPDEFVMTRLDDLIDEIKANKKASIPIEEKTIKESIKVDTKELGDIGVSTEEPKALDYSFSFTHVPETKNENKMEYIDFKAINLKERPTRNLGTIVIIPTVKDLIDETVYSIPLQNNLEFESFSRKANYNTYDFLGRVGGIKQYIGTDSQSISVSTEYFVENSDVYNMLKLQNIERKYKSLIFPSIDIDTNKENIVKLTKPPIVNIALNEDYTTKNENNNNNFNLFKNYHGDYTNYIVTNVSIEKDIEKFRYYTISDSEENNEEIVSTDIDGFKVTLTLTEIDYNYYYDDDSIASSLY